MRVSRPFIPGDPEWAFPRHRWVIPPERTPDQRAPHRTARLWRISHQRWSAPVLPCHRGRRRPSPGPGHDLPTSPHWSGTRSLHYYPCAACRPGPERRRAVNATFGSPDITVGSLAFSDRLVRKGDDLPIDEFASVHSNVSSLLASSGRTCDSALGHLAITQSGTRTSRGASGPSIRDDGSRHYRRAAPARRANGSWSRGWIR